MKVRHVLHALALAALGALLLSITFLVNFLFFSLVGVIISEELLSTRDWTWFSPARHALFMAAILLVSWPVLRSRLGTFWKATYLTVPLSVGLATIGILLNRWPPLVYVVGGAATAAILVYLHRTRRSWLYYYAVILIAVSLMVFTLTGGEI